MKKTLVIITNPFLISPTAKISRDALRFFSRGEYLGSIFFLYRDNSRSLQECCGPFGNEYTFRTDHDALSLRYAFQQGFVFGFHVFFYKVLDRIGAFFGRPLVSETKILYKRCKQIMDSQGITRIICIENRQNTHSKSTYLLAKRLKMETGIVWSELPAVRGTESFNQRYIFKLSRKISVFYVRKRDMYHFDTISNKASIVECELPCFLENYCQNNSPLNNDILFFGRLRPDDANTTLLLELARCLPDYTFVCFLTNLETVARSVELPINVILKPATPIDACHEIISKCRALLCIESTVTVGKTSKYITYFSSGKPVLFVGDVSDIQQQLDAYGSYHVIRTVSEQSVKATKHFLEDAKAIDVSLFLSKCKELNSEVIFSKWIGQNE